MNRSGGPDCTARCVTAEGESDQRRRAALRRRRSRSTESATLSGSGQSCTRESTSQYKQYYATPLCLETAGLLRAARDGKSPEEQDSVASTRRPRETVPRAQTEPLLMY